VNDVVLSGRLHPVTPLRHSWVALSAVGLLVWDLWDTVRAVEKVYVGKWIAGVAVLVLVAVVVVLAVMAWRRTSYELTHTALEYRRGWVWREHKRFELASVQSVDIVRPLFARMLGVCALNLRMPSGDAKLEFLSRSTAHRIRAAILATQTGEDAGLVVSSVSAKDLALAILLDLGTIQSLVWGLGLALTPWLVFHEPLALGAVLPWLRRAWGLTAKRYPREYGWTLRRVEGGHQAEYGMVNRDQYTYRNAKVTSIRLRQPILWKRRGWVGVEVSVAGAKFGTASTTPTLRELLRRVAPKFGTMIPVTTWDSALELIGSVFGEDAVTALAEENRRPVGREARWCTPWWRAVAWSSTDTHVVGWRGFFLRNEVHISPLDRASLVTAHQGWWQRRHGRASVGVWVPGGVVVWAAHRELADAVEVAADLRKAALNGVLASDPMRRPVLGAVDQAAERLPSAVG
jgi:putative membrane protein